MKDPSHHKTSLQKKVLRSARQEEEALETSSERMPKHSEAPLEEHRVSEEGIWYESYEERLPVRKDLTKGRQVEPVVKREH